VTIPTFGGQTGCEIGPLQARLLKLMWLNGLDTVHLIHAAMKAENEAAHEAPLAYTTLLTVMRNLVKRGFLTQVAEGRRHRFYPTLSREEYQAMLAKHILERHYDGSLQAFSEAAAS
jgi:predicted transcriptional regulator